jgi:pyruvate/2-oxoglutarate/acetoin dehydrogenase E1 component
MSIREQLTESMTMLGRHPEFVALGYNCRYGKAMGTMSGVPEDKLWEMPLAENLMLGAAIGVSMEGKIPLVWVERCDFILCGLDAIVNHLNHISGLSGGIHKPVAIIRVCVGNSKSPLFTGPTHCQDFSNEIKGMVSFPVVSLWWSKTIIEEYASAMIRAREGISTMLFEFKDQLDA